MTVAVHQLNFSAGESEITFESKHFTSLIFWRGKGVILETFFDQLKDRHETHM